MLLATGRYRKAMASREASMRTATLAQISMRRELLSHFASDEADFAAICYHCSADILLAAISMVNKSRDAFDDDDDALGCVEAIRAIAIK